MKLRFHLMIWMLVPFAFTASGQASTSQAQDRPEKASVCELLANPRAWDHKLVQVTGLASYGFEDSGFSDPACTSRYGGLWMSYGGTKLTQTKSTVNETGPDRKNTLVVQGITIPLIEDSVFRHFDDLLHERKSRGPIGNTVHATVVARFFAGRLQKYPGGEQWGGFGHMGCCSLFVIQQVLSVDERHDPTLDSSDTPEQPDSYPFCYIPSIGDQVQILAEQRRRESSGYTPDAQQAAVEFMLGLTKTTDPGAIKVRTVSTTAARVNYEARIEGSKSVYRLAVSRPAWLEDYAKEPKKIAWFVIAAYGLGDGDIPGCRGTVSTLKK